MTSLLARRAFLGAGVGLIGGLYGCGSNKGENTAHSAYPRPQPVPAPPPALYPRTSASVAASGEGCAATVEQILGPYYLPEAPWRDSLIEPGMVGIPLAIEGTVRSLDCGPIDDALIEIWQADHAGAYDLRGPRLRARLQADQGRYRIQTILPGRYLNGAQYRPAHIHLRISGHGHRPLTTQLYFAGDPYNEVDPFLDHSLIRAVGEQNGKKRVEFDVVLAGA